MKLFQKYLTVLPHDTIKEYFKIKNTLNSNGVNYAPAINAFLYETGLLNEGDSFTYRIYLCNGQLESGYNIFFTYTSVVDKGNGTKVEKIIKFNSTTETYAKWTSVVAQDPEKNKDYKRRVF